MTNRKEVERWYGGPEGAASRWLHTFWATLPILLPETGCVYVRVAGIDDEHCALLVVDESEIEGS